MANGMELVASMLITGIVLAAFGGHAPRKARASRVRAAPGGVGAALLEARSVV